MSIIDQIAFDQIADERDKAQQENKLLNQRIKRLEREIELFREYADYGDVCLIDAIIKGEEIGRKENQNQQ